MKKENIIWGLLLILSAVILIVSKLGYLQNINAIGLIITIMCVYIMIKSIMSVNFGGILFPLAIIGIVYDKELGITAITPWTILFAAALLSLGLEMIFHRHKPHVYIDHHDDMEVINFADDSNVKCSTSFSGSAKYINTDDLKSVDLDVSFGGMKVYFDNAKIQGEEATVQLNVSFGGLELYIPKEWRVSNQLNVVMGGVAEKNRNQSTGTPTLTLVGNVKFSGVDIFYIQEMIIWILECQFHTMNLDFLRQQEDIYFTIHLDENLNVCDFNELVADAYFETVRQAIEIAKQLKAPILNIHLSNGIHFTMPDHKEYLFEIHKEYYLKQIKKFRDACDTWIGADDITIRVSYGTWKWKY